MAHVEHGRGDTYMGNFSKILTQQLANICKEQKPEKNLLIENHIGNTQFVLKGQWSGIKDNQQGYYYIKDCLQLQESKEQGKYHVAGVRS